MTITVTFKLGTDLDAAQVLVQNRVALAEPRLPEEVRRQGVVTRKTSPDFLMVVNLISPDGSLDRGYISNYALTQVTRPAGADRRRRRRAACSARATMRCGSGSTRAAPPRST